MTTRVLVVGAGVFGCTIARDLALSGFAVDVVERKEVILAGTTTHSVFRVHKGPHYPRSDDTAIQSRDSYSKFMSLFGDCVDYDFQNYYAISKIGSRTSTKSFSRFISRTEMDARRIDPAELENFGVDIESLDSAWQCLEGVYDVPKLRQFFLQTFSEYGIDLRTNIEVTRIEKVNGWRAFSGELFLGDYDFIVKATYMTDRISLDGAVSRELREFQQTLVLECSSPAFKRFGLTVLDGDFLTILPSSFKSTFYLYAPTPSVLSRSVGYEMSGLRSVSDLSKEIDFCSKEIVGRFLDLVPKIAALEIERELIGVRVIPANRTRDDRRTSQIQFLDQGFIEVFSGKVDHAVGVAEQVTASISQYL